MEYNAHTTYMLGVSEALDERKELVFHAAETSNFLTSTGQNESSFRKHDFELTLKGEQQN